LEQVYKFRKPMTNYQVPQNTLLKYKWVHMSCYNDTLFEIMFRLVRLYSDVHRLLMPAVTIKIEVYN
jgi:hypothetical protein